MVLLRLAHGLSAKTLASGYSLEPYLLSKITNMVVSDHKKIFWDVCVKAPSGMGIPAQNLFDDMLMKGRSVVVEAIALLSESRVLDIINAVRHYSYVLRNFLWHVGILTCQYIF
uniref:Uncharacterized protein n=1 Tax=Cajanus cajan TaxID=3821 RepID=A0A151QPP8_CAJCA|nr:hypothetical protein KK1_047138 [Cajanus cajan]